MIIILYLAVLTALLILMALSRKQKLPKRFKNEEGIQKSAYRMSGFIYYSLQKRYVKLRSASVSRNLSMLSFGHKYTDAEDEYYITKIMYVITLLFAGSALALAIHFAAINKSRLNDNSIERNTYGKGNLTKEVLADETDGEFLGEFTAEISEQRYTKEQIGELFDEFSNMIPDRILGDNQSLDEVNSDLTLFSQIDGYPFSVTWKIDNHTLISAEGKVKNEEVSNEGEVVKLYAVCTYYDETWKKIINVRIVPREYAPEEIMQNEMAEIFAESDNKTIYDETFSLPDTFRGKEISWTAKVDDNSFLMFLVVVISAVSIYIAKDKELEREVLQRKEELISAYPGFVSKLVLYMGAGMSLRNILFKLSEEYSLRKEKEFPDKGMFLYEEITVAVHELESGASEQAALEHLANRCNVTEYTRLCTLLVQNLRKGSGDLLRLLREESDKASQMRLSNARKAGEKAETKLLAPMMIMLGIVMVLIMIPAYMSF